MISKEAAKRLSVMLLALVMTLSMTGYSFVEAFAEDGIAAEVAKVLEGAGAKVSRNVGCGANRVDVAVRDPDDDARYVLGVACDGRGYAGERTARDRDRLRDEVLASLGWHICHAWVVDWAYDRPRAEKRLLEAFNNSIKKRKEQENDIR